MRVWDNYITEELREMYKHYHSVPMIGCRPCLLLIDLYNLSYKGGNKSVMEVIKTNPSGCGVNAHQAIQPTKELISFFRSEELPIIFTTRDWQAHSSGLHSTQRKRKGITPADYDIFPEFELFKTDFIIYKSRASVFYQTNLDNLIAHLGVDSIIVGGESTSGCVRASVVDAYSRGFPPILVEECVFDRNPVSHAVNLFDMHHKYAHVAKLTRVIELIKSRPGDTR